MVQIMACCQFVAKPSSEPMLNYSHLDPKEHIEIKSCVKTTISVQNAFENIVCKISAIFVSTLIC